MDTHKETSSAEQRDELSELAAQIEDAVLAQDYQKVSTLINDDPWGAWFTLPPPRLFEIAQILKEHIPLEGPVFEALASFMGSETAGSFDRHEFLGKVDFDNPHEVLTLTFMRMFDRRAHGHMTEALEHGRQVMTQLDSVEMLTDSLHSSATHMAVQVGITAMLAGDFSYALACFSRAQEQPPEPKFVFFTRDALTKSALIHASFGNASTAYTLLEQARTVQRTSSWAEAHIQAHDTFTDILLTIDDPSQSLNKLEAISLRDIGELWPFYVLAVHRLLESAGHFEELEHRITLLESMPFPKIDGDGFSGSIFAVKHAMIAIRAGRITEAQESLERGDPDLAYTRLTQAAVHVYAGRSQQAIADALTLHTETRDFRLMEIRRLAILSAGQYLAADTTACVQTLQSAVALPRGLQPHEAAFFSPEVRKLANQEVANWPEETQQDSLFLMGLPTVGGFLTDREIEIIQHLAKSLTRPQLAEALFISLNTLKTHLTSIYRKLDVTTAPEAIRRAQQRGLL